MNAILRFAACVAFFSLVSVARADIAPLPGDDHFAQRKPTAVAMAIGTTLSLVLVAGGLWLVRRSRNKN